MVDIRYSHKTYQTKDGIFACEAWHNQGEVDVIEGQLVEYFDDEGIYEPLNIAAATLPHKGVFMAVDLPLIVEPGHTEVHWKTPKCMRAAGYAPPIGSSWNYWKHCRDQYKKTGELSW